MKHTIFPGLSIPVKLIPFGSGCAGGAATGAGAGCGAEAGAFGACGAAAAFCAFLKFCAFCAGFGVAGVCGSGSWAVSEAGVAPVVWVVFFWAALKRTSR